MNRNIKKFKEKIAPYHRCDFVDTVNDYLDEMGKELRELMLDYEPYRVPQIRIKEILGEECE